MSLMPIDQPKSEHEPSVTADGNDALDGLLVMRWQDGDSEAMDQLVRRWHKRFWHHARRLTDSNEEAWDVVQEAWLAMIRTIRRLDDPDCFKFWAFRIVSNKAVDRIRSKVRGKVDSLPNEETLVDLSPSETESIDQADQIISLISGLSVEHRAVISLRYGEDLTIAEIAASLGVKPGTVKSRLHYALQAIRQNLES